MHTHKSLLDFEEPGEGRGGQLSTVQLDECII